MPVLTKYEAVQVDEPQTPQVRLRSGSSAEKNNVNHSGRGHNAEDGGDGHDAYDVWDRDIRTADLLLGDTPTEESAPRRHRVLFFHLFGVRFRCSLPNFVSTAVESLLLPIVKGGR